MAKGGKRKGSGRKPTGKVAMLARVSPEVRERLTREAKAAGRSLSATVENALDDHLRQAVDEPTTTRALCYLIRQIITIGQSLERADGAAKFNWRTNRFDFEVLKHAVVRVLDRLAPAGDAKAGRYLIEKTPEAVARVVASMVFALLATDAGRLRTIGNSFGRIRGSLYYAFPQAAHDLGLTEGSKK
jgi:hypothetical protein